MAMKPQAQVGMDDTIVQNSELEALLEKREDLKQQTSAYRKADKEAKEAIAKVTTPKPYRVGRFVIAEAKREPNHIEFDTEGGTRLTIKNIEAK